MEFASLKLIQDVANAGKASPDILQFGLSHKLTVDLAQGQVYRADGCYGGAYLP